MDEAYLMGSTGLGTVWENPTRGLPISNPMYSWLLCINLILLLNVRADIWI